jgi:hypothetical protein
MKCVGILFLLASISSFYLYGMRYKKEMKDTHAGEGKIYKSDELNKQYGLIPEEVHQVFPEIILYDVSGEVCTLPWYIMNECLRPSLIKSSSFVKRFQNNFDQISDVLKKEKVIISDKKFALISELLAIRAPVILKLIE